MTDAKRVNELDLLAYADGLLDDDPGRKATVEETLRADPAAMARAEAFRQQSEALRAAYGWRLAEPVPERLTAMLERPASVRHGTALRVAAVVLLTVGAGTTGWMLGQGDEDEGWSAATLIERSYAQFVAESPGGVFSGDIEPTIGAKVGDVRPLGWLAEEVSIRLKAPDLTDTGFTLVDKQAVAVDGEQIVRLDYAGPEGSGFSLFLAPRWEARERGIAQAERGGVSMAYWLDGPLASTVVARMPAAETRALAEAVRRAMHADGNGPAVIEPGSGGRNAQGLDVMADTLTPPATGAPPQVLRTLDQGQGQVQQN